VADSRAGEPVQDQEALRHPATVSLAAGRECLLATL
jgi:hypothetical protein